MNQQLLQELTRRVLDQESAWRRSQIQRPVYDVLSLDTMVTITSDQNNFPLGNYDCVFIAPSGADRTIHGFTGGVAGRRLIVRNQNTTLNLLFTFQNALADADNRLVTTTGGTITLAPRRSAEFVYVMDSTLAAGSNRWLMIYPSS